MSSKKITAIKLTRQESNSDDQACGVCEGKAKSASVVAVSNDGLRICATCLEAGNVDERLEARALRLEQRAAALRSRIGRLSLPSFAEYTAANERVEAASERREVAQFARCSVGPDSVAADEEFDRVLTDDAVFATWRARFESWQKYEDEKQQLAYIRTKEWLRQTDDEDPF